MNPPPEAAALRVAVVGARRSNFGTGPFLALQAAAAGAEVCGVWGTSAYTADEASRWLGERGLSCPGYSDWNRLLVQGAPEVLIVAGPRDTHAAWLETGLRAHVHVLCEKPLMARRDAGELARDYAAAGLVLQEVCQWPFTLGAFRALHPEVDPATASRFRMRMTPAHDGRERWMEILSHPLSLLQAAAPGPVELQDVRFHDAGRLDFRWCTHKRSLECRIDAVPSDEYPRPAEYRFDDALLARRVEQPGYRFSFEDQAGQVVPGEDPMALQVAAFLERVAAARTHNAAALDEDLVRRQDLFARILAAWPA